MLPDKTENPQKPAPLADGQTVMMVGSGASDATRRPAPAAHFVVPVESPGHAVLVGSEPVLIGRSSESQLQLDDPATSGRHCQVQIKVTSMWVEDLGSTNGTLVNGRRITGKTLVPVGALLQVGETQLRHELRDERSVAEEAELSSELRSAARYITELLPEPWLDRPVRIGWRLLPCSRLGGDSFGYFALDPDRTAIYLIDVCGHGLRAALHSVSILNTLRQRSFPEDCSDPGAVLSHLNRSFPMESHSGMFFTMWFGVIDRARRQLRYASAGHPPAIVRGGDSATLRRLATTRPPIGTIEGVVYASETAELPADAALYLFSDGVIEEPGREGRPLGLTWLESVLLSPRGDLAKEPERIEAALRSASGTPRFHDDFTLLVAQIP